jgi:hypothetical protein
MKNYYALPIQTVLEELKTSCNGLSTQEVTCRREEAGLNQLENLKNLLHYTFFATV